MPLIDYDNELTALGGQGPIIATAFSTAGKAMGGYQDRGVAITRDWGQGEPLKFQGRVTQAFNNLTSLDVAIGGADDNAGTNFVTYLTVNFLLAALVLNALLNVGVVPAGKTKKAFLLGKFTVNGIAPAAGKISLFALAREAGSQDGFNVMA